jgi:hypothetical protein
MTVARTMVTTALLTMLGCGAALADPPGKRMSADEIKAELIGNTSIGAMANGGSAFVGYTTPEGVQKVKLGAMQDSGSYQITADGRWCTKWQKISGGQELCRLVYKDSDTYYWIDLAGSIVASFKVKAGNTGGL